MQVKCSKCSQPIWLTDVIESSEGRLSHIDCSRRSTLTPAERQLVFVYCFGHVVAECSACDTSYHFAQLGSDAIGGRTNMCPGCRRDLTDSIRTHLYGCSMAPAEILRRAQAVREKAQLLVKAAHELNDTSDVLIRQLEAALFAAQQALRDSMSKRTRRETG